MANIKDISAEKLEKEKVDSITVNLIFNLPEFIDLEYLKEKLRQCGLKGVEVFDKHELEGLISVPVKKLNITGAILEARNQVIEPVRDAILKSGFSNKIKDEIKESRASKSFINWVQATYCELKANKITKEEVREKTKLQFEDLLGDAGIEIIVNLFSSDEEHILNSWAELEDLFIQKLAIEFYIFQQIREASFVIVVIKSDDDETKSLVMNCEKIIIPITEDVEFYRRKINLPIGNPISNVFTHDKLEKVLMVFNPSRHTYSFMQKLMALRKTNSNLSFMTFMIERQNKIIDEGLTDLKFEKEYTLNQAIDLDPKKLGYTIESLKHLIDTIYFTHEDYVKPCKNVSKNLMTKRKLITSKEYKRHFQQKLTADDITAVIQPQEWMLTLIPEYNIEKTDELLNKSSEMHLQLLTLLRELREKLIEYKEAKEKKNKDKLVSVGKAILSVVWELAKLKMKLP